MSYYRLYYIFILCTRRCSKRYTNSIDKWGYIIGFSIWIFNNALMLTRNLEFCNVLVLIWNGFDHSLNLTKIQPNLIWPNPTAETLVLSQIMSGYLRKHQHHNLRCQRWPHPSRLQLGTINVLQVPILSFLSQIMYDLDKTFRISPISSKNMVYDV